MAAQQLTLAVNIQDNLTFANFFTANDNGLIQTLKNQWQTDGHSFIYLAGASGSGCSHLLQAACDYANQKGHQSLYLPLKALVHQSPSVLDGLQTYPLLAIDDIELLLGKADWQQALLHLYHLLQSREGLLLMSSHIAPQRLNLELKDLDSRLRSALLLKVHELNDEEKQQALILRAKMQGLLIDKKVAHYILAHTLRDMHQLQNLLDKLSEESLVEKRLITIPFVKQVLGLIDRTD